MELTIITIFTIFVLGSSRMLPAVGKVSPLNIELFEAELVAIRVSRKALDLVVINQ